MDTTLVLLGILPPTINTTPNSPTVCAKPRIIAVKKPGFESGSTTLKKVSNGLARNVAAASMNCCPMLENEACNGCTTKGSEYRTEETIKPAKLKGSMPNPKLVVKWPRGPDGPIKTSK